MLFIGCFHATKSTCKENETLAKAGCWPAAVTTELFACIVTGFTPVSSCPWKWGMAEESSAANCVLFHKHLFQALTLECPLLCIQSMFGSWLNEFEASFLEVISFGVQFTPLSFEAIIPEFGTFCVFLLKFSQSLKRPSTWQQNSRIPCKNLSTGSH